MSDWPDGVNQEDVYDIIDGVTASLTRRYRQWTTPDDIRQELRLWSWRKREKIATYLVREDTGKRRAGEAAYMKSLARHGDRYCRREKAKISGYEPDDEFFYTPTLIEACIAAHVQGLSALQAQVGELKVVRDPAEGGNMMTMITDVAGALSKLEPDQRALLIQLHGIGTDPVLIARMSGVSRQAVHQRAERAIKKMLRVLGSEWNEESPGRE